MEEDFEEEIWNVQTQIKQYNIIQQKLEKLNFTSPIPNNTWDFSKFDAIVKEKTGMEIKEVQYDEISLVIKYEYGILAIDVDPGLLWAKIKDTDKIRCAVHKKDPKENLKEQVMLAKKEKEDEFINGNFKFDLKSIEKMLLDQITEFEKEHPII